MTDLTPFEQRLGQRLVAELSGAVTPFDPAAIAAEASGRRSLADGLLNRLAIGPLPMATARKAALVGVAALLALVTMALAVGLSMRSRPAIAFIRANGEVVVAAPDGSAQSVIYHVPSPVLFTQLEWAPGGRHLAIVDEEFHLTIIDRAGSVVSVRQIEDGRAPIAWSPDGQWLAISDGPWLPNSGLGGGPQIHPRLDIIRPDGTLEWAVPLPPDFRYSFGNGAMAWSADGRWLAMIGSTHDGGYDVFPSSVWIVDMVERTVQDLLPGDAGTHEFDPTWLPDGRLLFARDDSGIWKADPATRTASRIFEIARETCEPVCLPARIAIYELSPDGDHLSLLHQTRGISVLDLATGELTEVPHANGIFGQTPITWTADGTALAFEFSATRDTPPSVVAVDLATGTQRVLVPDAGFFDVLR